MINDEVRIRRVSAGGVVSTLPALPTDRGIPRSISVAPDGTVLLLTDTRTGESSLAVYKMAPDGSTTLWLPSGSTDQSALRVVAGLNGSAYLIGANYVRTVPSTGSSVLIGGDAATSCGDGTGVKPGPVYINDAVLDGGGNLYVMGCYSVRRITPLGVVSTLAGDLNANSQAKDGVGAAARFGGYHGSLAIDRNGELRALDYDYQADAGGINPRYPYRLRAVTRGGAVTTLLSDTVPKTDDSRFDLNFDVQSVTGHAGFHQWGASWPTAPPSWRPPARFTSSTAVP